ncbi:FUSC family protein [Mycolicibacterium flavescens]|uniref:Fusaric acid resistance protein n=2 Tax=Mycolicibacterium flavescens TaxID=1776 RepID=A0A1E3RL37_MYCFV|nr:FUSC family protein [Mycolicibacterium flavescens]ODQ90593.1 fusaric acid resistance protein [Mycolicibacterium flavescens]
MPDGGAVARSLFAVLATTVLVLLWISGPAALWVAGAGAVAGAIGLQDSPGGRIARVGIASVQMGAAVLLGTLTASFDIVFVVAVALWCFVAGLQWAVGGNAGLVGAGATALLVVAPPVAPTVASVLLPTLLTIAAGGVQAALIAIWPPQRWRTQREALSDAYRALADEARQIGADAGSAAAHILDPSLRDAFIDTQASRRPEAYHGGHRPPERILATLRALRESPGVKDDDVTRMSEAAAEVLDAIAGQDHTARRDTEHGLVRLDATVTRLSGPEEALAQRLSRQLREVAKLRFPDLNRADLISPVRNAAQVVRSHMTLTSPVLRHAIRLSGAVALGVAADRFAPVAHGHWIALTVLMVLRPETAHTYTRCVGRLAGIAAGVVAASAIAAVVHPSGAVAALLATACVAVTYAVHRTGYIAGSVALAAATVFLLDIDAATSGATLEDRLFSIIIGGGLAVVAHVALPDHALTRLHQRAGELLKSEIDYAATVIKAYVHALDRQSDTVTSAWQRAYRARAGFEAASGAARVNTRALRRWLRSYRTALNAVTASCAALEDSLPPHPPAALTREFIAAVDDYIDALRGAPATPAAPWTVDVAALTAAAQQVRERAAGVTGDDGALRVLVAEIASITRSLAGIASISEPISAE